MANSIKILYLEANERDRSAFIRTIREKNLSYEVIAVETLAQARSRLAESSFDLVVASHDLPDGNSTELLDKVNAVPFVLLTRTLDEQVALRSFLPAVDDYLPKDPERHYIDALPLTIQRVLHQKRLAQEGRQAAEWLAAFMQNLPGAAWIKGLDGRYVSINSEAERIFGTSSDKILGKRDDEIFPPETARQFQENDRRALAEGGSVQINEILRQSDGVEHHSIVRKFALKGVGGQHEYVAGVAFDITDGLRAEKALRESEERLRRRAMVDGAIMANMGEGLYTLDTNGMVTYLNPAAERLLGFSSAELVGHKMHEMVHYQHPDGTSFPAEECPGLEVLRRGKILREQEDVFIRKGREFFPVVYSSAPIRLNGQTVGLVVVFRDITAQKQAEEELRREQAQLRQITGMMEAGVTRCSRDLRYLWVSPAYARWMGHPPEQIAGRPIVEMIGVGGYEDIRPYVEQVLSGKSVEYEAQVNFLQPGRRWISARYTPTHDHNGVVDGWVAVVTDITVRKKAEEELQESEERFRTLADALPVLIWECKPDLSCDYFNKSWLEFTGRTLEQEGGNGWAEGVHPDDKRRCLEIFTSAAEHKQPFEMEYRIRHHSGEYRWILDRGAPRWAHSDGTFLGYLGGCIDISERKRSEEVLRESEERLRKAISTPTVGVLFFRPNGRIHEANAAFERMSGYGPEELRQLEHWKKMTAPEFWDISAQHAGELASRGETPPFEKRMIRKDGSSWWGLFAPTRLFGSGSSSEFMAYVIDITDRKRAEEERKQAEDALVAAKAAAESANRAKDHFLAVLSHELRTPLTPVVMGVSLLQDKGDLDSNTRDTLEMIRSNVEMEARLIDDLLDVARIAKGKIELNQTLVELCGVIQRAIDVCKPDIEARSLHFGVDMGPSAPYWVKADVSRLQQVFWNLLKNAIKFTPNDGCVGIHCRPDNEHVIIEVADSGIGIEPGALSQIFDAFDQVEKSITRQFGGLGLGLAISKALVDMHGGTIEAHSNGLNKGTTFRVRLPLSAPGRVSEEPGPGISSEAVTPLHILLVEDHGVTAHMIKMVLGEKGHEVEVAGDKATALELVNRYSFDLLVSDLGLPDGSGHDLIRELRKRGKGFPGIALSGYGQEEDIRRSYEAGFTTHLTKPASREAVLAAVASAVKGNGHSASDFSIIHPVQADAQVFDADAALRRCFDKSETLREMVEFFPKESSESLSQMHSALGKADTAEVRRAAHRLKGSLFYLGAQPAVEAAAGVEEAAKTENPAEVENAVNELEHQIELLKKELVRRSSNPESKK